MKTWKKISIYVIISLAVFTGVEKDCLSFSNLSLYTIENTTNEEKSDNLITIDSDLFEADVMLTKSCYSFDLKNLSSQKVTVSGFIIPQNIYFCIWQPPKIS